MHRPFGAAHWSCSKDITPADLWKKSKKSAACPTLCVHLYDELQPCLSPWSWLPLWISGLARAGTEDAFPSSRWVCTAGGGGVVMGLYVGVNFFVKKNDNSGFCIQCIIQNLEAGQYRSEKVVCMPHDSNCIRQPLTL